MSTTLFNRHTRTAPKSLKASEDKFSNNVITLKTIDAAAMQFGMCCC
jgi:hypothetical protein